MINEFFLSSKNQEMFRGASRTTEANIPFSSGCGSLKRQPSMGSWTSPEV
ncbi:hypothetical protein [Streptomyces sp. NPDC059761]